MFACSSTSSRVWAAVLAIAAHPIAVCVNNIQCVDASKDAPPSENDAASIDIAITLRITPTTARLAAMCRDPGVHGDQNSKMPSNTPLWR